MDGQATAEVVPQRSGRDGRRWTPLLALLAAVALVAFVGSWWWSGVTASAGMSRLWADGGPADVSVSGVGQDLLVLDVARRQVEVSFDIGHRGVWPVQVVDVWGTTDPDGPPTCGLQAHTVTGASVSDWIETAPDRVISDLQVPREQLPALRRGDQLHVTVHGDGFGGSCHIGGGLVSTDRVTVTYRTLGITRRTEIPLPWTLGWTDEPQRWPEISRRLDSVQDEG